jgi:hypothetical protein
VWWNWGKVVEPQLTMVALILAIVAEGRRM